MTFEWDGYFCYYFTMAGCSCPTLMCVEGVREVGGDRDDKIMCSSSTAANTRPACVLS